MADFLEGQIVKTKRDNEFKIKVVDGQSGTAATKVMSVEQDGTAQSAGTNDFAVPILHKTDEATPNLVIPRTDPDGNTKVVIVPASDAGWVNGTNTHSGIAEDATDTFDTVITDLKTLKDLKVTVSSFGLIKWEIGIYDGVSAFTVWKTIVTSPAHPTLDLTFPGFTKDGDGTEALRVAATNKEDDSEDAYSTVEFIEETT